MNRLNTAKIATGNPTRADGQDGFTLEVAGPDERQRLASLPLVSSAGRSLERKVARGDVLLAKSHGQIVGLLIAELYGFFDENIISLVVVEEGLRRRGIGTALVEKAESLFGKGKLFMATGQSNLPMQKLCKKLGYQKVGHIENIQDHDPELIYLKRLG
jgi:ribosomal protein S18 acetylase RimI-like enzyme